MGDRQSMEMVKKILVYLGVFAACFSFSCKNQEEKQIKVRDSCYNWTLTIEELKEQILEYFNTVDTGHVQNSVLFLRVKDSPPFVKYGMSYITSISAFEDRDIHMIIDVDGHLVCVYFDRVRSSLLDFKLTKESIVKIMKRHFPNDYAYYLDVLNNLKRDSSYYGGNMHPMNFYPLPSTWAPETWTLTFKDGKMIDKKIKNQGE